MRNFTIYLTSLLCLFITQVFAQTFEQRAKEIADKIEKITKEEKEALKIEVEAVNTQLENGTITAEQAEEKKRQLAESRAKSIEFRVAQTENELMDLVQEKVEGKIKEQDSSKKFHFHYDHKYNKYKNTGEHRTTSQGVFAFGLTNLMTNNSIAHSDYRVWKSYFYEIGLTSNTRIMKDNNLLHAKYGLSLMYNNICPTENRLHVKNGKQTDLVTSAIHLEESRFRNVYIVVPLHLEFDFSKTELKDDKRIFRTHDGFRFGLGGYAGANIKSKQVLKFDDADNNDVTQKSKGDYNVNDFVYGFSSYIGYKEVSIYVKYDINPLFQDNLVDQNNISGGLRFDFN